MKAVLEIELPESCDECPSEIKSIRDGGRCCKKTGRPTDTQDHEVIYNKSRAPFCPLKIVPETGGR